MFANCMLFQALFVSFYCLRFCTYVITKSLIFANGMLFQAPLSRSIAYLFAFMLSLKVDVCKWYAILGFLSFSTTYVFVVMSLLTNPCNVLRHLRHTEQKLRSTQKSFCLLSQRANVYIIQAFGNQPHSIFIKKRKTTSERHRKQSHFLKQESLCLYGHV